MTATYVLYRMFDSAGDLLYVGATTNPAARFMQHGSDKSWWTDVANVTLQHLGSWQELNEAEAAAISTERPRYNTVHSDKPYTWARKPRRARGEGTIFQRADGKWVGRVELPSTGGRRRVKHVTSVDRNKCLAKFEAMKAELKRLGELADNT